MMNYALIQNGVVVNLIWLNPKTPFPNAVPIGTRRVSIGDTYADGEFYRDGERIPTQAEAELLAENAAYKDTNAAYEEALTTLGVLPLEEDDNEAETES